MLWDAARAPGGGAGLYIPYCGKRYPGTVHADGGAFRLCTGARWAAGSNRENGTAFGGICRRDFWKPVRRFFYMVQMRKFITCRVNNRICLRKLFRSYPIRQMSRERSRCLCLNSRVQRKLQRPRYVRQQTGRLSLSRKRQRRCIDSPCSLQEVKKSGAQVKTYTEPGTAAAGDRSVLAPMPIVTDTGKALFKCDLEK